MALLISALVFAALLGFILFLGYRLYARPGRVYQQLGGPAVITLPHLQHGETELNVVVSLLEKLGHVVPVSEDDASVVRRDLIAAGYRGENAVWIFFGARIVAVAALVALALLFRNSITSNPVLAIVIP